MHDLEILYQHGNRIKAKSQKVLGASLRRASAEKVICLVIPSMN